MQASLKERHGGGGTPIRIKEEYKVQEDRIQGSATKKERKKERTKNQTKKRSRDKVQRDWETNFKAPVLLTELQLSSEIVPEKVEEEQADGMWERRRTKTATRWENLTGRSR
jgi:hypothetical protein